MLNFFFFLNWNDLFHVCTRWNSGIQQDNSIIIIIYFYFLSKVVKMGPDMFIAKLPMSLEGCVCSVTDVNVDANATTHMIIF